MVNPSSWHDIMDRGVFFARAGDEPADDTTVAETVQATLLITPDMHLPVHYRVFQRLGCNQNQNLSMFLDIEINNEFILYLSIY